MYGIAINDYAVKERLKNYCYFKSGVLFNFVRKLNELFKNIEKCGLGKGSFLSRLLSRTDWL